MNTEATPNKSKKKTLTIILLVVVFVGPFLLAWGLIEYGDKRVLKLANHGELLSPPGKFKNIEIFDLAKKQNFNSTDILGKWWLIYIAPDRCLKECHDVLYNMRQIHTALGKSNHRLSRMFLSLPSCQMQDCDSYIMEHYPEMTRAGISQDDFDKTFSKTSDPLTRQTVGELYLVDPKGNIIIHYSGDLETRGILSDIKRLLKISQIG